MTLLVGGSVAILYCVNVGGYPVKGSIWALNVSLLFCLAFLGLGIPVLMRCISGPATVLTIDDEGIMHAWYHQKKIKWSNIQGIRLSYYKYNGAFYLYVRDKSLIGELTSGKIFSLLNRPFGWGNFGFPLIGISTDSKSVRDSIAHYCDNPELVKLL